MMAWRVCPSGPTFAPRIRSNSSAAAAVAPVFVQPLGVSGFEKPIALGPKLLFPLRRCFRLHDASVDLGKFALEPSRIIERSLLHGTKSSKLSPSGPSAGLRCLR